MLEFGALLASGGQVLPFPLSRIISLNFLVFVLDIDLFYEFEVANDFTNNPKERLAKQKQNLKRRLGMS